MRKLRLILTAIFVMALVTCLTACGCDHEWQEATCVQAKTCVKCEETEGEALGHTWEAATCTAPETCGRCGETQGEALGHVWEAATCTAPETCGRCGETQGEALGHSVTDWTVTEKAAYDESGTREGTCAVCGETVTEAYSLSGEEREQAFKQACGTYSYDEIARSPGSYEGKRAKFTGEVIQVQQSNGQGLVVYVMRVNVTKGRYSYKDTVYTTYLTTEDAPRILEDDIITMYGTLEGEKTYTTVLGASVTIPAFTAIYVDIA